MEVRKREGENERRGGVEGGKEEGERRMQGGEERGKGGG